MKKLRHALKSAISLCLIAALGASSSAQAPALTRIGAAGAVRGMVKAFARGDKPVGRILTSGKDLYLNDTITTGSEGSLQVMLIDETVFTIGPNSSMVLDEFVYDPSSRSGKVMASVTKGVFRFVTGQIGHKHPSDMKVKFPVGTMGVRGTIVAGQVSPSAATVVLLGPGPANDVPGERVGAFSLENAGGRVDVVKPGYGTYIFGADAPPSQPALLPPAALNNILGQISHAPLHDAKPSGQQGDSSAPAAASNPDQTGSAADGDPSSATDSSGESTAGAVGDLSNTQTVSDLGTGLSAAEQQASNDVNDLQSLIAQNQSTWDDVRAITTGQGQYAGAGNFFLSKCEGVACANASGPHGTVDVVVNIDFGARTIGGLVAGASANSRVIITAADTKLASSGGSITDTVNFPATGFGALAGPATLSGTSLTGNLSADVSLVNIGGPAGSAAVVASYNDLAKNTQGAGTALVPRADCSVAGACK